MHAKANAELVSECTNLKRLLSSTGTPQAVIEAHASAVARGEGVVVLRELLQNLANPERQRWSASAYYSATLEAAISHIANIARTRGRGGAVR